MASQKVERPVARRPCLIQQRMMIGRHSAMGRVMSDSQVCTERRRTDVQAVNSSDAGFAAQCQMLLLNQHYFTALCHEVFHILRAPAY